MLVTVVDDVDEIMYVGKWRFEVVDMFSKQQNDILDKVTEYSFEFSLGSNSLNKLN